MGLYDRDYVTNQVREKRGQQKAQSGYYGANLDLASFIKETYQLFAASMVAGAAGSYVGVGIAGEISANYWWIAIPWLLFGMFGLGLVKDKSPINYIFLFLFTFVGGIIISPLLSHVLSMSNGASLVANAFITTSLVFGGLSIYAMNSQSDFSSWGKPLAISLFIIIIVSLLNIFFFHSSIGSILISGIVVFIISGFVLYDTQNIIKGNYQTPIEGAMGLYLDFFNLFTSILQLFGYFGGED